jgi:hypothetical protein
MAGTRDADDTELRQWLRLSSVPCLPSGTCDVIDHHPARAVFFRVTCRTLRRRRAEETSRP